MLSPSNGPFTHGAAVTPSDSTVLTQATLALYVGTAGNVAITWVTGGNNTFVAVPAGTVLPVRASKVLSTGTTAINIVALT